MEENRAIKCLVCDDALVESVTHEHKPFVAICNNCVLHNKDKVIDTIRGIKKISLEVNFKKGTAEGDVEDTGVE